MHRRGFTLLEMMVAMALAGVLAASALGAGMAIHNVLVDTRRRVVVWDEAKRVEEALLSHVQEAGGDPMAAADSIIVEDNCLADPTRLLPDCAGADRITIMRTSASSASCTVTPSGTTLKDTTVGPAPCCIDASFVGPAVLLAFDGDVITLNLHSPNTSSCQVVAPRGQGNPGTPALKPGVLALLGAGNIETIFPRSKGTNGEYELLVWKDVGAPPNGRVDPDELELFADRLWDFQIALGYDSSPEDGDVVDNNSNSDEWVGNAEVVSGLPTGVSRSQLRMIDIAVAVGVPSSRFNSPVQLLNRTAPLTPNNVYLAATRGQVGFRNLNLSVP